MSALLQNCCSEQDVFEYWHENVSCDTADCEVDECNACGKWATSCGMKSEEE